jgi:ubiquinone/menaquinone biosynthesis C-methylase UbiE
MSARRTSHPLFSRFYARVSPAMDAGGIAARRQQLLAGLTGTVIEIGAGTGLNFGYYPAGVSRVLAVEPDPFLRRIAHHNAASAPVPVEVTDGVAEELPAGDGAFDAAVATFVLCSVASQQTVLREIHRVLRPGGELRFLEHVRAESPGWRRAQHLLDMTLWSVVCGGDHTGRDTAAAVRAAGFTIERLDRFRFPDGRLTLPTSPHVSAIASRTP